MKGQIFALVLLFPTFSFPSLAYHFTEDEFYGMAKTVVDIREQFDPQNHIFIGVGRSPAPIMAMQQLSGDTPINLPPTWSTSPSRFLKRVIARSKKNTANSD